jgi:hypothetical protein
MAKQKPVVLQGTLEAFNEQGTEGTIWSFNEDLAVRVNSYEGLHGLKKGDFLRVFNDASKKEVIFEGKINLVYTYKNKKTRFNHGYQKGVDPAVWARMFYQEKPAELIVRGLKTP